MNPSNVSDTQPRTAESSTEGHGGGAIASAAQGVKTTARDAVSQLKTAATTAASRAREETQRFATDKKSTAAERIGSYSSAIHQSAQSLEENDPNIAWFTHRAADRLQSVADYVRERDFTDLRYDVEDVARRHPALFFGGLFVAGLLLGNVMKASRRRSSDEITNDEDTSDWAASASDPGFPSSTIADPAPSSGL